MRLNRPSGRNRAAVDNMRAFIAKKQVRAPFDGQLGIRQVNVGQSIDARSAVVQLTALDPVYVDFALPQQELSKLATGLKHACTPTRTGPRIQRKSDRYQFDGRHGDPQRRGSGDSRKSGPRSETGDVRQGRRRVAGESKTLVIPGSAVSYAPYGDSVFVIENKKDPRPAKNRNVYGRHLCDRRCPRRFRFDHEGLESRRHDCQHGRVQAAQRNGGHDQQRSRTQAAVESRPRPIRRYKSQHESRLPISSSNGRCWRWWLAS